MSLKTSLSEKPVSRALIKSDLRNHWPWPVVAFVIMLLNFMAATDSYYRMDIVKVTRFTNDFTFTYFAMCVYGLFVGTKLFMYLDKINSVSCMHGLPFSRLKLYLSHICSGCILMFAPAVATSLIILVSRTVPAEYAFMFLVSCIIYASMAFAVAVFAMTVCGNMVVSVLFSLAIAIFPAAILAFSVYICNMNLYGYAEPELLEQIMYFLYVMPDKLFPWRFAIYLVASLGFLAAGYAVYRVRPLENCEEVVAFKKLRPMFIYAVGLVTGMISYFFFCSILDGTSVMYMLPLGLVGVVAAVMIARKTVSLKGSGRHVIIYTAAVTAIMLCMQYDITGYETRVPDADKIAYAEINGGIGSGSRYYRDFEFRYDSLPENRLTELNELEALTQLHAAYASEHDRIHLHTNSIFGMYNRDNIEITYKLKNGTVMKRRYDGLSVENFDKYMLPFLNLEKVKSWQYPLIDSTAKEILSAAVYDSRIQNAAKGFEAADAVILYDALCADIRSLPVDKLYSRGKITVDIEYYVPGTIIATGIRPKGMQQKRAYGTETSIKINENYTHTLAALKRLGYDITNPKDFEKVKSAVVSNITENEQYYYDSVIVEETTSFPMAAVTEEYVKYADEYGKDYTVVTDRADLEKLYDLCGKGFMGNAQVEDFEKLEVYIISLRDENDKEIFGSEFVVIHDKLPQTLKKYFLQPQK